MQNNSIQLKLSQGKLLTFDETLRQLADGVPHGSQQVYTGGAGLIRAKHFYKLLDNPQEQYKTIHVAGTSGKGSVTHIMSHLLKAHGFRVGTFVSPHVYDIRERILLDCKPISKTQFAATSSALLTSALAMQPDQPSFFETINGVAFQSFADKKADYAVIETGLGGTYDSTNTIERSDKLALITTLGLDHMHVLGDTLEAIAAQKAGIIPFSGNAFAAQPAKISVQDVLSAHAAERSTKLSYVTDKHTTYSSATADGIIFDYHSESLRLTRLELSLSGPYQAGNAALALRALEFLAQRDGFEISERAIRAALKGIKIPGRFEQRSVFDKPVILDGAHNPQKIQAFVQALSDHSIHNANWVVALKAAKDSTGILQIIAPYVRTLYATEFSGGFNTMHIHSSQPAQDLAATATRSGIQNVEVIPDSHEALRLACLHSTDDIPVIVSGSFYLLGEINARLSKT